MKCRVNVSTCFNKPPYYILCGIFILSVFSLPPLVLQVLKFIHGWSSIFAEVPSSFAPGMPLDNYKPFNKHGWAARADILTLSQ